MRARALLCLRARHTARRGPGRFRRPPPTWLESQTFRLLENAEKLEQSKPTSPGRPAALQLSLGRPARALIAHPLLAAFTSCLHPRLSLSLPVHRRSPTPPPPAPPPPSLHTRLEETARHARPGRRPYLALVLLLLLLQGQLNEDLLELFVAIVDAKLLKRVDLATPSARTSEPRAAGRAGARRRGPCAVLHSKRRAIPGRT